MVDKPIETAQNFLQDILSRIRAAGLHGAVYVAQTERYPVGMVFSGVAGMVGDGLTLAHRQALADQTVLNVGRLMQKERQQCSEWMATQRPESPSCPVISNGDTEPTVH